MLNKRILLGITGGIAAYKIAFLIRLLKKQGAEVRCILTPASLHFISPLVVSTLSENKVGIEFWNKSTGEWTNHVEYGLWADLFVIAPLTANTLSKLATGSCDNLLLATYLSMKCPSMVAPAMDLDMFAHPTTKRNLNTLEQDGVIVIPSEHGELASGLIGEGRMAEPETILKHIEKFFTGNDSLKGQKVLVTAGPTYESIDPVRFIGNHSSGKMGFAIAETLLNYGAEVTLIHGPTECELSHDNLSKIAIRSAEDLLRETKLVWSKMSAGVFAAAVADYKTVDVAKEKIKKSDSNISIELTKNPDILAWAGSEKKPNQFLLGFALETENLIENGTKKLLKKNLDAIVLNSLKDKGAGFGVDTNKITILDKDNKLTEFELKSKKELSIDIVEYLKNRIV